MLNEVKKLIGLIELIELIKKRLKAQGKWQKGKGTRFKVKLRKGHMAQGERHKGEDIKLKTRG